MFMTPTDDSAKNLIDRAEQLGVKINVDTYHRVFGFGCRDEFPRDKYNMFVLDIECSMLSSDNLTIIMDKLNQTKNCYWLATFGSCRVLMRPQYMITGQV